MSATGHQLEEVQELAVAMTGGRRRSPDHLQGSKQGRGAVSDIVVGTPLGPARADRQGG
jgi:hypothetical protein